MAGQLTYATTRDEAAREPNDLERLFVGRANAGDLDGLVALYEPAALLVSDDGLQVTGVAGIRAFLAEHLKGGRQLVPGIQAPALVAGGLALTASRHGNGTVSVEVARRQADGSWLWVIDRFAI